MSKKKKIIVWSNSSVLKTGLGKHARVLLSGLYKRGYDVVEYCGHPFTWDDSRLKGLPWPAFGGVPESHEIDPQWDENQRMLVSVGHFNLDRIIKQEKPDFLFMVEDPWHLVGVPFRPWFSKINSVVWTPLDSVPIHESILQTAGITKHLWVKAPFAEEELKKLGHDHVKTVPFLLPSKPFFPLQENEREKLRNSFGIENDCFVAGFVFRNQLRKLVPVLLEGYKIFKDKNPGVKSKLLLHSFFSEPAWNIMKLADEIGIDKSEICSTYFCRQCNGFFVAPYQGQTLNCPHCHTENAALNVNSEIGVSEEQLGLVYNCMDSYQHPVTSGGWEGPNVEAMYCGLPIATVPYAFGTNFTRNPDVFAYEIDFYREQGSMFKKSQPRATSVAASLQHFYDMGRQGRKEVGQRLRDWALSEFHEEKWLDYIAEFIEFQPPIDYDFNFDALCNDKHPINETLENVDFLKDLYKNIFLTEIDENNEEFKGLLQGLKNGTTKKQIFEAFIGKARENNEKHSKPKLTDLVKSSDNKKLLFIMPASGGDSFMCLSIVERLFQLYEDWDIYVATNPKYFDIYAHLPLSGLLKYEPYMDSFKACEGVQDQLGAFDIVFQPYMVSQKFPCYIHNGLDKNELQ